LFAALLDRNFDFDFRLQANIAPVEKTYHRSARQDQVRHNEPGAREQLSGMMRAEDGALRPEPTE
jgi:hypothetical protein